MGGGRGFFFLLYKAPWSSGFALFLACSLLLLLLVVVDVIDVDPSGCNYLSTTRYAR